MDLSWCPEVDATSQQAPQHVETLIEAYAPLVKYLAHRLACRLPASISLEDLISAGVLGLLDAINQYDPQRPHTSKTYAAYRIRGAMLDALRQGDGVPRSVREKEQALTEAYAALERQHGRPAADEEVAAWLGLDLDAFSDWLTQVRGISCVSWDPPLEFAPDGPTLTLDMVLVDEAPGPLQRAETQDLKRHLAEAIDALPWQEKVVLSLYYDEELTMPEIGQVLELTVSRIAQIHTTALLHIRAALHNLTHSPSAPVS
jgi:RNA polymerase sigma factor FliA